MAGEFKILFVLCVVALCFGTPTATSTTSTAASTSSPTTTAAASTAAPTSSPTTTAAASTAAPTSSPTTTATASTATPTATPTTPAATPTTPTTPTSGATGGTSTTEQPTTGGTVATTKPQTTTESSDPCDAGPCGHGSTCEPRTDKFFVCLCLPGENYNEAMKSCEKAKVFPGELSLSKLPYDKEMSNKRSPVFHNTANSIITEVSAGFKLETGFSDATVLELLPLETKATGGVKATIEIIFKADADITASVVDGQIKETIESCGKDCLVNGGDFNGKTLCESSACDNKTAKCEPGEGSFTCTCEDGYIKTPFSERMCTACPSGQKKKDATSCTDCSFGYSGFNCNESWELVLTIVGSILSCLLLVTLILLPVVARKSSSSKKVKKSKEADIGMFQVNQPNTKAPMATSNFHNSHTAPANPGMPSIPRVTATGWDRSNLDMTPSNSRQNLIPASRTSRYGDDDDTGSYAQGLPQGSIYSQARSQNNPYAQTRPQNNPYASGQGQSGPYFAQDVGRRY